MGIFCRKTHFIHQDYRKAGDFILSIPSLFEKGEGTVIYKGRNELRMFEHQGVEYIVKSYRIPNIINRFVYGLFRPSKAQRSYEYALKLLGIGVGTPFPVAYMTESNGLLFGKSYFVSLKSTCSHIYKELFESKFEEEDEVLNQVAVVTATLHNNNISHLDYGRANILFEKVGEEIKIELVDLNRMRFAPVSMDEGCKNLERLPATPRMHKILSEEYARLRGFNPDKCLELMKKYRSRDNNLIDGLY